MTDKTDLIYNCRATFKVVSGFCSYCGVVHKPKPNKLALNDARSRANERAAERRIEGDEALSFARRMIRDLDREFDVETAVIFSRHQLKSYARRSDLSITLGRSTLRSLFDGATSPSYPWERRLLTEIAGSPSLSGYTAVHFHILHEFAHILDYHLNGDRCDRNHGNQYQEIYKELIEAYPVGALGN